MTIVRVICIVTTIVAVFVIAVARLITLSGISPIPIRFLVIAISTIVALTLWGIFDRRSPMFGRIISRVKPRTPAVAITFDDGPTEPYTSQILDVLRAYDARATFFVLGLRAAAHPDVVRRLVEEGHEIANHGWDHQPLPLRSIAHIRQTIRRTSDTIAEIAGRRPALFRAPFGWRNPWLNRSARLEACEPIAWSVGVNDTDRPGSGVIARRAIRGLQNGAIVLLHDGRSLDPAPDASQVVDALPSILRAARERGYRMLTVSDLMADAK